MQPRNQLIANDQGGLPGGRGGCWEHRRVRANQAGSGGGTGTWRWEQSSYLGGQLPSPLLSYSRKWGSW